MGGRGLISHKFEGTGEGGAGMCTEGWPRSCARVHGAAGCEPGVQLADARWARLAAGRVHSGCELGVQLAVARWARLTAGRVHNGHAAGGDVCSYRWSYLSTDGSVCSIGIVMSRDLGEELEALEGGPWSLGTRCPPGESR